ncbi:ribonuclease P protein component [Pedobacter sp. SYSU D00535]|uniref:ribonuclease P protein component n=1 Tax=Pedobacter sp. SYSU D00535 TaxID=2810308 RepID=UPI001A96658B|nr:ribonuclease P protein component [Pedobacter sp. SYSU D00535]
MYTFKKEERLCSKKLLERLFHNGSSFLLYPFRIVYLPEVLPESLNSQVVIGVSKRKFKRAVDRNLIKRRIREAYRLNKEEALYAFLRDNQLQLVFSINYVGKEIGSFKFIEKKLMAALKQLVKANAQSDS